MFDSKMAYLSILYATGKMYGYKTKALKNEAFSDRMPADLWARYMHPKLLKLIKATEALFHGKHLFDVDIDDEVRARCVAISETISSGAKPLLDGMERRLRLYPEHLSPRAFVKSTSLRLDSHGQYFQYAFKDELLAFEASLYQLEEDLRSLEDDNPGLKDLRINEYWKVPN